VLIAYDYTRRSGCAPPHGDAQFGTGIAYDFSRPSCRTKAEEHLQRTVPDQKRVDGDEGGDHQLGERQWRVRRARRCGMLGGAQRERCQRRKVLSASSMAGRIRLTPMTMIGNSPASITSTGQVELALGARAREGRRPPLSPREHTEVGEQVVGEAGVAGPLPWPGVPS
jgi:hypothetical protein